MIGAIPLLGIAEVAYADDYCRRCATPLDVADVGEHGTDGLFPSRCPDGRSGSSEPSSLAWDGRQRVMFAGRAA